MVLGLSWFELHNLDNHLKIALQYQNFKDVFEKNSVDMLSEHQRYDCAIELQERVKPLIRLIYNLFQIEITIIQLYIYVNLTKGLICHSKSPTEWIFYILKIRMGLCKCPLTIKGSIRLPKKLLSTTFDFKTLEQLIYENIFTKIDLKRIYDLIRIKEGMNG